MKKYVFLRINNQFRNFFLYDNLNSFLELYYRRDESVFYKEQFRLFLEKNKQKEIINYLKSKMSKRLLFDNNKIILVNDFGNTNEVLEVRDNYILINGNFEKSVFSKYLSEYDNDFLVIDLNQSKIERLALVN